MKSPLLLAVAIATLSACTTYSAPPPYGASGYATNLITTGNKAPFGTFLVDASGRSVYVLDGSRGQTGFNRCSGACLNEWPPVRATAPLQPGPALDPVRLTTVAGPAGPQAAYDGWPLYYFDEDRAPGDTRGQGVRDEWGYWTLVAPNGAQIRSY